MRAGWDDVSKGMKTALVIRIGTATTNVVNTCRVCNPAFPGRGGLRVHWRSVSEDDCFLTLIGELEDKLFAGGDVF